MMKCGVFFNLISILQYFFILMKMKDPVALGILSLFDVQ